LGELVLNSLLPVVNPQLEIEYETEQGLKTVTYAGLLVKPEPIQPKDKGLYTVSFYTVNIESFKLLHEQENSLDFLEGAWAL
jgi:hypothetical protein